MAGFAVARREATVRQLLLAGPGMNRPEEPFETAD